MPRLRIGGSSTDVNLHGTVWDASDLLTSLARTNLRSFVPGPWGKGDADIANEMIRRCMTPPCAGQCFIVAHTEGKTAKVGCGCSSGWQYTSDEDVQTLEGCGPNDVWNDARGLMLNHLKVSRGESDPILCDCDDLAAICAAVAKYSIWRRAGSPMKGGMPVDVRGSEVQLGITKPHGKNMAHAYVLLPDEPAVTVGLFADGEPTIKIGNHYVFDPAGRWGMRRPPNSFYGSGDVAVYPVRLADL